MIPVQAQSNFVRLWMAHSASIAGSQISAVAMPLLAITLLDANALELGLIAAAGYLPTILFGLIVGIWVDRVSKRRLMIVADRGRAICLLTIPIAAWTDHASIALLAGVTFVSGALSITFNIASLSLLPSLVPPERVVEANARLQLSTSIAQVAGPAAAGGLVAFISAPAAILIDSFSYLISAIFLGRIRTVDHPVTQGERREYRAELGTGIRTIRSNPALGGVLASAVATAFFGQIFFTVLALFLTTRIGLGPAGIGVILTIGGVGAATATVVTSAIPRRIGAERTILLGQVLFGLSGFVLFLAFLMPRFAAGIVAFSMFFQWGFNTLRAVNAASLVQLHTPISELGRTQSTILLALGSAELLGSLVAGGSGLLIGTSATIAIAEIGMAVAVIPLLKFHRLPDANRVVSRG